MVCDLPYAHELSGRAEILAQVAEQRPLLIVVTRGLLEDDIPRLEVDRSLFRRDHMRASLDSAPIEDLRDLGARTASLLAETDPPEAEQDQQDGSTESSQEIGSGVLPS